MSAKERLRRVVLVAAVAGLVAAGLPAVAHGEARERLSGAGGGLGADFTGDGLPDLLVREKGTGNLRVHLHSGTFDGTRTYPSVVTINAGWQNMRWIGALDLTGDGLAEVLAIDQNWRLVVAVHSGTFNGTSTLKPGLRVIGYNWNVNNLVSVVPGGLIARRADTGDVFRYESTGLNGTSTFLPPSHVTTAGYDEHDTDRFVTTTRLGSGEDAVLFVTAGGELYARDIGVPTRKVLLGTGWNTVDQYLLTDIDHDGYVDIIARTGHVLQVYRNSRADPWGVDPFAVYPTYTHIGYGFDTYDIIT
jgi:VCBS repeat protein